MEKLQPGLAKHLGKKVPHLLSEMRWPGWREAPAWQSIAYRSRPGQEPQLASFPGVREQPAEGVPEQHALAGEAGGLVELLWILPDPRAAKEN